MPRPEPIRKILDAYDPVVESVVHEFEADEFDEEEDRGLDYAVGAHVRDPEGRLLLVKNGWSRGWVCPGGGVDPGEDLRAAAAREVREETGVEAHVGDPVYVEDGTWVAGTYESRMYFVVFDAVAEDPEIGDDVGVAGETIEDVGWFADPPPEGLDPMMARRVDDPFTGSGR